MNEIGLGRRRRLHPEEVHQGGAKDLIWQYATGDTPLIRAARNESFKFKPYLFIPY